MDLKAAVKRGPGRPPALDVEKVREDLRERFAGQIQETQELAQSIEVSDQVTAEYAVNLGTQIKQVIRDIEEARKSWVSDPDRFVRSVNEVARYYRRQFEGIEKNLKEKVNAFQKAERERQRQEAERRQREREEAERKRREAQQAAESGTEGQEGQSPGEAPEEVPEPPQEATEPHSAPSTNIQSESGKATTRTRMTFRVTDKAAVPEDYKQIDNKAVNAAIKDGIREIPGIEIYEELETQFRS